MRTNQATTTPIESALDVWQNGAPEAIPEAPEAGEIPLFSDDEIAEQQRLDAEAAASGDGGDGGIEGEETEEEKAAKAAAAAEASAIPETLKIGEADVPTTQVVQVYENVSGILAELKDNGFDGDFGQVVEKGVTYTNLMVEFGKGEQEAAAVVSAVMSAYLGQYGKDLPEDQREAIDIRTIDPKSLDGTSKALYGVVLVQNQKIDEMAAALANVTKEAKKLNDTHTQSQIETQELGLIKTNFPDAKLTAEQLRELKTKHGTTNGLSAYRLENMETIVAAAKESGRKEGETTKPNVVAGVDTSLEIDPNVDSVSVIESKLRRQAERQGRGTPTQ